MWSVSMKESSGNNRFLEYLVKVNHCHHLVKWVIRKGNEGLSKQDSDLVPIPILITNTWIHHFHHHQHYRHHHYHISHIFQNKIPPFICSLWHHHRPQTPKEDLSGEILPSLCFTPICPDKDVGQFHKTDEIFLLPALTGKRVAEIGRSPIMMFKRPTSHSAALSEIRLSFTEFRISKSERSRILGNLPLLTRARQAVEGILLFDHTWYLSIFEHHFII